MALAQLAIGALALAALLLLPGFCLELRTSSRDLRGMVPLLRAFIGSIAIFVALGAALTGTGSFSATILAIVVIPLAAVGVIPFYGWARETARNATRIDLIVLAAMVAMVIPWILLAVDPGQPRSSTFEWYYWQIGRQLSDAGGVPAAVAEYGQLVRWLPDYLGFNLLSEAYRGLLPFIQDDLLISAWRVPIAFGGLVALYLVLRLWLHSAPALVGAGAIATTALFVTKFNVYKPESLGILIGAAALILLVTGVRYRRPSLILWAGLAIGLGANVHAIAATIFGLLMVAAGLVELARHRRGRLAIVRTLAAAAALSAVLVVTMGWSLQGRVSVISDALRPTLTQGEDPTWTYLRRSNGDFSGRSVPPRLIDEVASSVTRPWPNEPILAGRNQWLLAVAGIGALLALAFAGRLTLSGIGVALLGGALIVAGMAAFALAFDTYVPRHTGLGRMGQYIPMFVGGLLGFAFAGYLAAWSRIVGRRVPAIGSVAVAAIGVAIAVPYVNSSYYAAETRLPPAGREALAALRSMAAPGDMALSNAITYGTIEFFSGVEAPLEGRQPLIEEPELLTDVNELLISMNRFLVSPFNRNAVEAIANLGARWLIAVDDPATLGADELFGGSISRLASDPTYRLAWQGDGVAIFESLLPRTEALQLQPAEPRPARLVAAALALALAGAAVVVVGLGRVGPLVDFATRKVRRRGGQALV